MDSYLVSLLVLLLFIACFGGLSLLRREPRSARFALESLVLGGAIVGLAWTTRTPLSPLAFFLVLYLVAMRSRLLVEVANLLARQGRISAALRLYAWALRLAGDATSRVVVQVNRAAALLLGGRVAEVVTLLEGVLAPGHGLGIKWEAAAHYNLGQAYVRQGQTGLGRAQFHEVIALLPGSPYAQHAARALERLRSA